MEQHHKDSLEKPSEDILTACFKEYGSHLALLERKDINALKKRVAELKSMQRNLTRDLNDSDRQRTALL